MADLDERVAHLQVQTNNLEFKVKEMAAKMDVIDKYFREVEAEFEGFRKQIKELLG